MSADFLKNVAMRKVYVDGSCLKIGTPQASAGYGVFWGDNHDLNCSKVVTGDKHTNQIAEIQAMGLFSSKCAWGGRILKNFSFLGWLYLKISNC